MTAYGILIYTIVALWLAPGSLWRPVALALMVQWSVGEAIYAHTGIHVHTDYYRITDRLIIAVVLIWRSHPSDWLVIAPYPIVWFLYTQDHNWYPLYWIAVFQFVLAGPWPQLQNALSTYTHGPRSAGVFNAKRGS